MRRLNLLEHLYKGNQYLNMQFKMAVKTKTYVPFATLPLKPKISKKKKENRQSTEHQYENEFFVAPTWFLEIEKKRECRTVVN